MIKVIFEFPKRELSCFFLVFGLGSVNYDKAMRFLLIVWLIDKASCLPTIFPESAIAKILCFFLNRFGHFGYNYITDSFFVEWFDELMVEESGVRTNSNSVKIFGNFPLNSQPEHLNSGYRMGVTRTQKSMSGILGYVLRSKSEDDNWDVLVWQGCIRLWLLEFSIRRLAGQSNPDRR